MLLFCILKNAAMAISFLVRRSLCTSAHVIAEGIPELKIVRI